MKSARILRGIGQDPTKKSDSEGRPSFFVPSATFPKPKATLKAPPEAKRPMSGWDLALSNFKAEWRTHGFWHQSPSSINGNQWLSSDEVA